MRRLLIGVLCVLAVACSDDDPSEPRAVQIPGSYTLQTINGRALPFELFNFLNAYVLTQTAGRMTLNSDFTFRDENTVRENFVDPILGPIANDTTIVFTGTYEAQDSALLLNATQDGIVYFGYVSGNRLTLSYELADSLFTFVYQRN